MAAPLFISRMSIRTKLTLVFSIVLGIIALFVYYFLPGRLETLNYEALLDKVESIAFQSAYIVSPSLVFHDSVSAREALSIAARDRDIVYLVVVDESGRVFIAHRLGEAERYHYQEDLTGEAIRKGDDLASVSVPVTHNERVIGQLYVGMSLARLREQIEDSKSTVLILITLLFVLGFLVVYVLTYLVVSPLSDMVRTVGKITAGDLSQRAEVTSHDEVGELALAFNEMVHSLASMQQQLKEANQSLETRVVERTRDLARSEEALRQTGEQLRALSTHLQTIREEERAYISREIHDQLGQMLTAMNIDLAVVEKQLSKIGTSPVHTALIEKVRYLSAMVESTIQRMRRLALELRPDVLDNLGLVEALEWQVREFETRTNIRCDLSIQAKPIAADEAKAIALFRMLQESLTNIMRHAHATKVEVHLKEQDGKILLQIHDNGRGINEKDLLGIRSLGIIGMRERAAHLGGVARVTGTPGKGTTVAVEIPLVTEEDQHAPDHSSEPEASGGERTAGS